MALPESTKLAFAARAREALVSFPDMGGRCVAVCAYISARLTEDGVANRVALGSLTCNSIKAFEYSGPFSAVMASAQSWDGHAWIELPGGYIGEASLFRTARIAPARSNLRQSLDAQGVLGKGAILVSAPEALSLYGLGYQQVSYLEEDLFLPLINGLFQTNGQAPW